MPKSPAKQPRWLTPTEQRAWLAFLAMQELLTGSLDAQLQRDSGMPLTYYAVLVMLSAAPERSLRMSDLAAATTTSASRLSHAVAKLEERGWVERRSCPEDKRGTLATLTQAGQLVLEKSAPGHVEAVRRGLFDQLSAEQVTQLTDICEAALGALDPDGLTHLHRAQRAVLS